MRLLLVEDEARLARALQRVLTADGFTVEWTGDGASGLERAREGSFDAVLLDVMLPRLSGYDVVRTLRAEENWVPVLMLSAKAGEHDEADGLDYGADDYLTKPFSFVVLLARLRALVRRDPAPRPVVLRQAGVTLDPSSRRVEVDGEGVALAPREFVLLEHLMRAGSVVVPKDELLDRVWGGLEDPNVVEVYVGYLRRKLGRSRIETVRGAGYRMAQ